MRLRLSLLILLAVMVAMPLQAQAVQSAQSALSFSRASYPTGVGPNGVEAADFNGDGFADLAAANGGSNSVSILINKRDGTFAAAASPAVGAFPIGVTTGDLDGNGAADLVTAN